jgi:hypothetical protein
MNNLFLSYKVYKSSLIVFATIFLCVIALPSFAQLTPEQRIQDSVIGWWDNNKFDNALKPTTDPLQKKRVDITNLITDWVKKSYTPVGGLGTVTRINNSTSFGVKFLVWNVSHDKEWTDAKGRFKPIPEENTPFGLWCNLIPACYKVPFLNYDGANYFVWPTDGYRSTVENKADLDLKKFPALSKFYTRSNESQIVILAPGNKMPFVEVTIGEYLNGALANIDKELQKKKDDILDANRGSDESTVKRRESFYAYQDEEFERFRKGIRKWLELYKDRLNEPALVNHLQPTIYDFHGDTDPFRKSISDPVHPVYKIPKDVIEKCKTDKPQWIAAYCYYENEERGNQLYEMYRSFTEHINYEYIYNYFFDPEKVKGKPYTPSNETQLKERLEEYRKKNAVSNTPTAAVSSTNSGSIFSDDFSSSKEGGDPANWFFKRYGKHAVVTTIKNQPGKWLQLGYGTPVHPSLLKKPLPQNFRLAFDMVTEGDFESRTGGAISLSLNTSAPTADGTEITGGNACRINMDIIAGNERDYTNNNYMGALKVTINANPDVNKQNYSEGISYTYPLVEFTNKKTTVHVAVTVKNNVVTVFINDKPVAESTSFKLAYGGKCINCGVPSGTKFNSIFWNNTTNDADHVKVYMSNVKITKE